MPKSAPTLPKQIEFHYSTSPDHRTVYVDGVRGVITPRQALRATFFMEHPPLPDTDIHDVVPTPDGERLRIGDATTPEQSDVLRVDREQQVTLVFNRKGLADLNPFLAAKLDELTQMEQADAQSSVGDVQ